MPAGYKLTSFVPQSPSDNIVPIWCKRADSGLKPLAKNGASQAMSVCFKNLSGSALSNIALTIECYLEKI